MQNGDVIDCELWFAAEQSVQTLFQIGWTNAAIYLHDTASNQLLRIAHTPEKPENLALPDPLPMYDHNTPSAIYQVTTQPKQRRQRGGEHHLNLSGNPIIHRPAHQPVKPSQRQITQLGLPTTVCWYH